MTDHKCPKHGIEECQLNNHQRDNGIYHHCTSADGLILNLSWQEPVKGRIF